MSYNPANITGIIEYSHFHNGSVVVNANSPWKTIDEFIAYAKQHPGMSYATAGAGGVPTGSQQQGVVALMQCKGLQFKHVPTKGGTEANTQAAMILPHWNTSPRIRSLMIPTVRVICSVV